MTKYRSQRVVVDGFSFASKAEARRYGELRILERAGEISGLRLQPVYILEPANKADKLRAIKYIGDFEYWENKTGGFVCEDVKGVRTPVYRLKRQLFLRRFPEIEHREIC